MAWIPLTIADLKTSLNSQEVESYSTALADTEMPVRADEILAQVVQQIRDDIASYQLNVLSVEDDLIPDGYSYHALALARYRLLSSLPYCEITESRKEEYKEAIKFFDSVANGKRRPEQPDNPRDITAAPDRPRPGAQVVSSRTNIVGRENLSGL